MSQTLLTARQVADLLQVSLRTAYRYAADGTIPARKVGGTVRFHRADLADLLDA